MSNKHIAKEVDTFGLVCGMALGVALAGVLACDSSDYSEEDTSAGSTTTTTPEATPLPNSSSSSSPTSNTPSSNTPSSSPTTTPTSSPPNPGGGGGGTIPGLPQRDGGAGGACGSCVITNCKDVISACLASNDCAALLTCEMTSCNDVCKK